MEYQIISNIAARTVLFVDDDMTVGEIRAVIGAMIDAPEEVEMVVSYNGRQLRNDAEVWVDAVSGAGSAPAVRKLHCNVTGRPRVESQSAELLRAVVPTREVAMEEERAERAKARAMEPMVEAMANNPQMLESMMAMQPEMKKMMKDNPEVARQLKDPAVLKEMMMAQLDPDRRRETSRNMELAMSQISNYPGGQQMFERYMNGFLRDAEGPTERTAADLHTTSEELARPDPAKNANTSALPNPWQQQQQQFGGANPGMMGMGGSPFGFNPFTAPSGPSPSGPGQAAADPFAADPATMQQVMQMMAAMQPPAAPPQANYGAQLQVLMDMGFEDRELCKEALAACHGDVEAAVTYIADKID